MLLPCFYRYPSFAPKVPKYPLKKRSSVPVVTASNNTMMAPPAMRSVAYDNETPQSPSQQPDSAKSAGESSFSPSNEQNALLSLTLNEIQLKRGKSLGSMNMDEFLANLWSAADETRASSKQRSHTEPFDNNNPVANQPALARQGSFSIPMPLCKKTVDEVLYEITKEQSQALESNSNNCSQPPPQRQQTLAEMTLEDFLVKAGVIHGTPLSLQKKIEMASQRSNAYMDASPRMGEVIGVGFAAQQSVGNNNFLAGGNGFVAYQMFPQSKGCVGEAANDHTKNEKDHAMVEMLAQHNKTRIIDGPPEVVVERRQRRMIKNRESAARSRARKQAYTVELELELNQLKEENAMLKQIVEQIDKKRKEQVLRRKHSTLSEKRASKLRSLRRTASLTW